MVLKEKKNSNKSLIARKEVINFIFKLFLLLFKNDKVIKPFIINITHKWN